MNKSNSDDCETRSLLLYMLSASQDNAESLLAIGDIYYYQLEDKAEAAFMYQRAADHRLSHASFNLGIMHEVLLLFLLFNDQ